MRSTCLCDLELRSIGFRCPQATEVWVVQQLQTERLIMEISYEGGGSSHNMTEVNAGCIRLFDELLH